MALTVNTNIASLTAQRNLTGSQSSLSTSLERLSSGLRINSAKDDAAGLAISERFSAQIRGLNQGVRNANDGISLAQTAEGALKEVTSNLQRIRELAVQSANATNSASDRASLQVEVQQLKDEIQRVATTTTFNGISLLDGTFSAKSFQVGANASDTVSITSIASSKLADLGQGNTYESAASSGVINTNTALTDGEVYVNGVKIGASDDTSAKSKAAAVNAVSADSGVTATASTLVTGGAIAVAGPGAGSSNTYDISINGIYITYTMTDDDDGTDAEDTIASAIAQINAQTANTGVTAGRDASTGRLTLSSSDGSNIVLGEATDESGDAFATDGLSVLGLTSGTKYGTIEYASTSQYGIQFTSADQAGNITTSGSALAANTGGATGYLKLASADINELPDTTTANAGISALTVATATDASAALTNIDLALDAVNSSRANLGAYQNRFESVVANLQTTAENLSASRSRIVDADFASETANLTKAQILQQSGIAMLAQANALPQNVLALLQ